MNNLYTNTNTSTSVHKLSLCLESSGKIGGRAQRRGFFTLLLLLTLSIANAWGAASVELCTAWTSNMAYGTAYTNTYSVDDLSGGKTTVSFAVKGVYKQNASDTYFQMNKKTGYFKNTSKFPGKITKIVTTWNVAKGATKCYFATSGEATSSNKTVTVTAATSVTFEAPTDADYYFFNLDVSSTSGACKLTSCVVYYEAAATCTTPTFSIADKSITLAEAETGEYDMSSNLTINKGGSTGAITYSCNNSDVDVTDGKFNVLEAGSYEITATMAADDTYCEASTTFTITVTDDCTAPDTELAFSNSQCTLGDDAAIELSDLQTSGSGNGGTITYAFASTVAKEEAEISQGTFYGYKAATYTITATQDKNGDKCAQTATFTITVLTPAYTVTFDAGTNGTCTTQSLTESAAGAGVTLPSVTANTGYTFVGWATSSSATTADAGAAGATYKPSANITLYAVYAQIYTITWMNNGAAVATTSVTQGSAVTLPTTPTSCSTEYATFVGWYTEAAGSESSPTASLPATQVTAATIPAANATYYAVFSNSTGGGGYTKLTTNAFNSGATYVLGAEQASGNTTVWYFCSYNDNNSSNESWGVMTSDPATTAPITFTLSGTADALVAKDASGNYLTPLATGKFRMSSTSQTLTLKDNGTIYNPSSEKYNLRHNYNNGSGGLRWYNSGTTGISAYFYEVASSASGYISSCCSDAAVVTVAPAATTLELPESGKATTTVGCTQAGGGSGTWSYAVTPSTATFDGSTFTATAAGTYTLTATYTENCAKSGSATITVKATPVVNITQSGTLAIAAACGSATTDQSVTLSGYNLTAGITVTSSNSAITVATAADGTYGSSATYAATDKKVNTPLYIKVTAPAESTTAISGTLTIASTGATSQTLTVNATVTCVQKTLTFDANGGSNPPAGGQYYVNATVTLPEQGTMTAPTNKVFVGWNTSKTATTALTSYTMPANDATLYAIWRAANYTIVCATPEQITTQAGTAKTATATVTLTDQTDFKVGTVSGTHASKFSVTKGDGIIVVTFNPPAGTAEGSYTATVTLTGALGGSTTVTLRGAVTTLAPQAWDTSSIDAYCYDNGGDLTIYLSETLYKDGAVIGTNDNDFCNNVVLTDLTLGTAATIAENTSSGSAYVRFARANMTLGHTYRLTFTNAAALTNADGTPYTDATCEFTIKNCNTITLLPACPVTTTGFTANWDNAGDCSGTQTLNVYTKSETEILSAVMPSAGTTNLNLWNKYTNPYKDKWFYYLKDGSLTKDANGVMLAGSSKLCYVYTPQLGKMNSSITVDANTEFEVTAVVYSSKSSKKLACIAINGEPTNKTGTTTGDAVKFNGTEATSWTSDVVKATTTTFTFTVSGVRDSTRLAFYESTTTTEKDLYLKSVTIKTLSKNTVATQEVACSATSQAVSGLTKGTTYYYTVGGSAEQSVATRRAAAEVDFDQAKLTIQSDDGICSLGEVAVEGTNVSVCRDDISLSISGTNASLFAYNADALTYNVNTGTIGGSVVVTYCPGTARGTHTATLTLTVGGTPYTLDLEGVSCDSYAPNAPTVGATYAVANLGQTMSGTIKLTDLGKAGENLLSNGGFENGVKTGWESSLTGQINVEQSSTQKHSGSYSLHVPSNGASRTVGRAQVSCLYSNTTALEGDYALSFYIYLPNSYQEEEFYYGLIDANGKVLDYAYSGEIATRKQWLLLSASFSAVSGTYGIFIGRRTTQADDFYIDDVVLSKTSAGEEQTYSFSNATAPVIDNLWPGHSYSYSIVNNGTNCQYGPFEFTTNDSTITPQIIVESPLTISSQAGNGKSGSIVTVVEAQWCTADVLITKSSDACENCDDCDNFTIDSKQLSATGGTLKITFTPGADVSDLTRECNLVMTSGDATATLHLIGVVSAGSDPSAPLVEVVDIDTTMLAIEHNIPGTEEVEIVLNREMTEDEIIENVGLELFFSKYYEASQTVKLWAVYNPTNDTIDLTGTYVWLGANGNAWNTQSMCDLSALGNYEKGKIYPNEELIVYASDGTSAILNCAGTKTDMSSWFGLKPQSAKALSFDGDDALALVRAETNARFSGRKSDGTTQTFNYKIEGRDTTLTWRYIDYPTFTFVEDKSIPVVGSDSIRYQMLDLIGARKASNQPDNSKCSTPHFSNGESGDEEGWNSPTGKDMNGQSFDNPDGKYDVLSTNRCLLVRSKAVKAGSRAIVSNQGDFYTLADEWQGSHVPNGNRDTETAISCENFAYVGGFDYANYYTSYTPIDGEYTKFTLTEVDSTWITNDFETLRDYTCKTLLVECVAYVDVNGVSVREVKASTEYKVPIIVNIDATTAHKELFRYSEDTCKVCDVVILSDRKLEHQSDGSGRHEFRDVKTFPGGNFHVASGQTFTVQHLEMQAKNNTVSYATVDGTLTVSGDLVHEKRIDSKQWYSFALPYECSIAAIRQLNGKSLGQYGQDWWIQYYDGEARAETGTWSDDGTSYNGATYWKTFDDANNTLKAHRAYLIGLGGINEGARLKNVYFPPLSQDDSYTESGSDEKTFVVQPYTGTATNRADSKYQNDRGWNFIGHPYISNFNQTKTTTGVNVDEVKMGYWTGTDYSNTDKVYVNIPADDGQSYIQNLASAVTLEPFKGCFVQVAGETEATLSFEKKARELNHAPQRRAIAHELHADVILQIADAAGNSDVTGILVDERYTDQYEVARDLVKMGGYTLARPQICTYSTDGSHQRLAFNALPATSARHIPMDIYTPKTGRYTLAINRAQSDLSGVTAVLLHYNGVVVANLLETDYTIDNNTRRPVTYTGQYTITIERVAQVVTPIDAPTDAVAPIAFVEHGQVRIDQLPTNGQLRIVDAVGRQLHTQPLDGAATCTLQHLPAGVYMIVIDGNNQHYLLRTIVE